jgi:L-cysteine:1D-myo-inositol 2-amino-2-deoxy-alpha-D-glucopyranoside ligase
MAHHYRADWEWFDDDIATGARLLDRLHHAARAAGGPDPADYGTRVRAALDDDLDAPSALHALTELADAILEGGDDPAAPTVLGELGALVGIDLGAAPAPLT